MYRYTKMDFQVDTDAYTNQLEELKAIRHEMKEKANALQEYKDTIFKHMEDNDLETFAVGQYVFQKQTRSRCVWSKKQLIGCAVDGMVNINDYIAQNTEEKIIYTTKKRKRG